MNSDGSGQTRLTSNNGFEGYPDWSATNLIAFVSERDGFWNIYTMNADGSNVTRLTSPTSHNWQPDWSPDGSQIVFTSERDGNAEIYVMNSDGSNVRRLTSNTAADVSPCWITVSDIIPTVTRTPTATPTPSATPSGTATATATLSATVPPSSNIHRINSGASAAQTSTDAQTLRSLIRDPSCQNPCFMGIEVDVTTVSQAYNIFVSLDIYFTYTGETLLSDGTWFWTPDGSQPFVNEVGNPAGAWITFVNGRVAQITLPLDYVPVATVLEAFGNPTVIRASTLTHTLVYSQLRLVFNIVDGYRPDTVNAVHLISGLTARNMLTTPIGQEVAQPCPIYGVPPCIAPTATPAP